MAGDLKRRLRRIREAETERREVSGRSNPEASQRTAMEPARAGLGLGPPWEAIAEGVHASSRVEALDGAGAWAIDTVFSKRGRGEPIYARDCVFLDFETTGLSGGAGTVAFLAGIGRFSERGFSTTLYFLADYPYEAAFLEAVEAELSSAKAVVTYNGGSFDLPLYRTRRAMNGLSPTGVGLHLDALHAARRLWRRPLGDCSLGNVERLVLGERREDDLPGAQIPEAWFDYLRRGASRSTETLDRAFEHNRIDIRSLASLFVLVAETVAGEAEPGVADLVGLAELRSRIDDRLAEPTLRLAVDAGDSRAVRPLARLYARQGRWEERRALVPFLPDDPRGLFSKSVYAERVGKDLSGSAVLAERAALAARPGSSLALAAARRAERLKRRAGKR